MLRTYSNGSSSGNSARRAGPPLPSLMTQSEEEGSEDTEESASSGESEDINDASSQNSRGSDESEESEASQKPAAKRKSRESSDFPTKGRFKKTKFQQTFKLLLAPRSGSSTSRMATKAIEQAKKGLKELRAALIGVNTLWLQARSPSEKPNFLGWASLFTIAASIQTSLGLVKRQWSFSTSLLMSYVRLMTHPNQIQRFWKSTGYAVTSKARILIQNERQTNLSLSRYGR